MMLIKPIASGPFPNQMRLTEGDRVVSNSGRVGVVIGSNNDRVNPYIVKWDDCEDPMVAGSWAGLGKTQKCQP